MIRCKRIYNFLCSMLVLHQLPYVLSMLRCTFYAFSGTNLSTRYPSASSCFLLFLVLEILHRKYSQNWTGQKPEVLYLTWQHRRPRGIRRHAVRRPHLCQARPRDGPRLGMVWPPWVPPGLAPPPIYSPPRENPKYPSIIPRKVPTPPSSSTLVREGSEALPGTLPEGEIISGGIFIAMPASEVICE